MATLVLALTGIAVSAPQWGADGTEREPQTHVSRLDGAASRSATLDRCRAARRGVWWYSRWERHWRERMGQRRGAGLSTIPSAGNQAVACPRYLAHVLQRKARAAREEYKRWVEFHYDWPSWLPDKWARIGACETGYGRRPGNWRHSNSSYEGAFGFAKSSWDAFKYRADPKAGPYPADAWQATPRQQYEVALAIWRAYGFSGWGCRGA